MAAKKLFSPPFPLYTYDHLKGNIEDLYAGDVSIEDFKKNQLTPVAEVVRIEKIASSANRSGISRHIDKDKFVQDYINSFMSKKEPEHIKEWEDMVEWVSTNPLETVVLGFVDKATAEKASSLADKKDVKKRKVFESSLVNKRVSKHDHITSKKQHKRNLNNIREILVKDIENHGVNVNNYKIIENKKDKIGLVAFNSFSDKMNGLAMLTNGTMGYKVEVISYTCLGPKKGEIQYRYTIYDHFGLDEQDVSMKDARPHMKLHIDQLFGSRLKFLSWFYLQRVVGYKPVITKIVNEYTVSTETTWTTHVK